MDHDQKVTYLHLDDIIPNRFQPREVFDERALKELAVSIKEHGVIQPIIVREINNNKYEIIAGERRYKASALAGLTTIPAIIRNLDDKEAAKVALLENLQRKNLNPMEEARTYQKIIELDDMTQEELAKTMGKSQSAVANKLRLLALPDEIQKALLEEEISERHARALLNLSTQKEQQEMLQKIIQNKMTVRQLENEIKGINMPNQDEIKGKEDLNSIINPQPVPIKNERKDNSFLMNPNAPIPQDDQIINYGEIQDEEEEQEEFLESEQKPIDISKIRQDTKDINEIYNEEKEPSKETASDLDSLLNLVSPKIETKKFSPAEEALRESENNSENKEDYFSSPDLMNINIPNASISNNKKTNNKQSSPAFDSLIDFTKQTPLSSSSEKKSLTDLDQTLFQKPTDPSIQNNNKTQSLGAALMQEAHNNVQDQQEQYNIQQMVNEIRKTLANLEQHGARIDTDEMNFENQYQILIRIDKNSNY